MRHWNRKGMQPILTEFEYDGVVMLKFPLLEQTGMIVQGFSTRIGGVSGGDCATMNFSYAQGDEPENLKRKYTSFCHSDGVLSGANGDVAADTYSQCTCCYRERCGKRVSARTGLHRRGWTDNECSGASADDYLCGLCAIVLGSGSPSIWTVSFGAAGNECPNGCSYTACDAQRIMERFRRTSTPPLDRRIRQDCYEVSEDVAQQVRSAFPSASWPMLLSKHGDGDGRYQMNLWNANRDLLIRAGVSPKRIEVTDICTCCNADKLHSHRRTGGKRGALAAFLCIKEQK